MAAVFSKKNLHRRGAEGGNESTGARSGTDCELCGEYYGEGCNNWRGLIAAIRPEAYKCGVKPLEFQEMSLFEVHEYIEAYHERQKDKFRYEAILLSGLASQVINAFSQQPKNLTLKKMYPELFEEPNQNIPRNAKKRRLFRHGKRSLTHKGGSVRGFPFILDEIW